MLNLGALSHDGLSPARAPGGPGRYGGGGAECLDAVGFLPFGFAGGGGPGWMIWTPQGDSIESCGGGGGGGGGAVVCGSSIGSSHSSVCDGLLKSRLYPHMFCPGEEDGPACPISIIIGGGGGGGGGTGIFPLLEAFFFFSLFTVVSSGSSWSGTETEMGRGGGRPLGVANCQLPVHGGPNSTTGAQPSGLGAGGGSGTFRGRFPKILLARFPLLGCRCGRSIPTHGSPRGGTGGGGGGGRNVFSVTLMTSSIIHVQMQDKEVRAYHQSFALELENPASPPAWQAAPHRPTWSIWTLPAHRQKRARRPN